MIENENSDVGVLLYTYKMHFLKDRQYAISDYNPTAWYRSNLIIPVTENKREKIYQGKNIVNKLSGETGGGWKIGQICNS